MARSSKSTFAKVNSRALAIKNLDLKLRILRRFVSVVSRTFGALGPTQQLRQRWFAGPLASSPHAAKHSMRKLC